MWYWRFLTCCHFKLCGRLAIFACQMFYWYNHTIFIYINAKWIQDSKTLACTIRECTIVGNVIHVTSTCPFISWWSGATNFKWTPQVWHYSLNSVKVNCDSASDEILSKYHHINSSIFPNLDWNVSSLSITSSVENFSMP